MRNVAATLRFRTRGTGLMEITGEVRGWLESQGVKTGLLTLFCRHTSASLLIQENAARAVRSDLERFFAARAAWRVGPGKVFTFSSIATELTSARSLCT